MQRCENFYSSNLLCICPSLFETNIKKAKYSIYEFFASQVPVLTRNKATNSSASNNPFSPTVKILVFGNSSCLAARDVCH